MARILVIDDEKIVRDMLRNLLQHAGHQVTEAPEGEEGLRLYRAESPDLLITDVFMPGKNGIQVIEEVRGEDPDAKIIAIAAHALEGIPLAKEAGADRAIGKPFDVQELLGVVKGVLGEASRADGGQADGEGRWEASRGPGRTIRIWSYEEPCHRRLKFH